MTTLRDFLAVRRSEIQTQIKALRSELREIEAASAALQENRENTAPSATAKNSRGSGPTLKEMAVAVLADHTDGLEANDVLDRIAERFGIQVKRESMSPQLSRLAKEGIIRRGGHNKWLLKAITSTSAEESQEADDSEADDFDLLA